MQTSPLELRKIAIFWCLYFDPNSYNSLTMDVYESFQAFEQPSNTHRDCLIAALGSLCEAGRSNHTRSKSDNMRLCLAQATFPRSDPNKPIQQKN